MWTLYIVCLMVLFSCFAVQADFDPQNPRVEDRLALQDFMTQYCTAVDTRDFQKFKSLFTKDAVLDYTDTLLGGKGSVSFLGRMEIFLT
jgi:hypothetical protein